MQPIKTSPISYRIPNRTEPVYCQITYEPLDLSLNKKLPLSEKHKYIDLLMRAQVTPKEVFSEVVELYSRNPDSPEIANLLTYLHLQRKEVDKAEHLIEETYRKNPDYLFAKINYGDQALRKKKPELLLELFPSFSLCELYPKREIFHFTEFRGFMVLMSHYHLSLGKEKAAREFYFAAMEVDPAHLSVMALEKKFGPGGLFGQTWGILNRAGKQVIKLFQKR